MAAGRDVVKIELVGVAGTGKSTLAQMLAARNPDWRIADSIHAREPGHLRYFVHCAPELAQLLAHGLRRRPYPSWAELKAFVYACEWHRYLRARPEHRPSVVLLDQGPVFALASLLWGASGVTSSAWFRSWMRAAAARWALELDVVVELTAADDVLFERINERAKHHLAKGTSALETAHVLARHRRAYDEVLAEVVGSGDVRLLRFDTSQWPLARIAQEISANVSSAPAPLDGARSHEQRMKRATRTAARDRVERLGSLG